MVKKFFFLNKSEIVYCGHVLLVILTVKKLLECFMKKNCKDKSEIWLGKNMTNLVLFTAGMIKVVMILNEAIFF